MKKMVKRLVLGLLLTATVLTGVGCAGQSVPKFSDDIYLGYYYGGCGYGTIYDCMSMYLVIHTNHEMDVYMPDSTSYRSYTQELLATLTLTDEQYENIVKGIDRKKLYTLDPKEQNDICDGDRTDIDLYGEDGKVVKTCGGYMPANKDLKNMERVIYANVPADKLAELREAHIEKLMEMDGVEY